VKVDAVLQLEQILLDDEYLLLILADLCFAGREILDQPAYKAMISTA
jgi:hypothetical protein